MVADRELLAALITWQFFLARTRRLSTQMTPHAKTVVVRVEKIVAEVRHRLLDGIPAADLKTAFAVVQQISETISASLDLTA